jgi:hypothetical protein
MMLNTRFGCDAKVKKVLASAAEGAVKVRSLLLTYIPSPVANGPPIKLREVDVVTSELQPLPNVVVHVPEGNAAGSLLKMTLFSDAVTVPVDPVSKVLMTVAEAFETKSKLANAMLAALNFPSGNRFKLIPINLPPNSRLAVVAHWISRRIMTAMALGVQRGVSNIDKKSTRYCSSTYIRNSSQRQGSRGCEGVPLLSDVLWLDGLAGEIVCLDTASDGGAVRTI